MEAGLIMRPRRSHVPVGLQGDGGDNVRRRLDRARLRARKASGWGWFV
jgi:hypothetical protein